MQNKQKILEATAFKDKGNDYFRQKQFKKALSAYHQANLYLAGLYEKQSQYYSYDKKMQLTEEEAKQARQLKQNVFMNMGQVYLLQNRPEKALKMQNQIKISLNNASEYGKPTKLRYRKATALMQLEQFDEARKQLKSIENPDEQTTREIIEKQRQIDQMEKKSAAKMSLNFKKMFG